MKLQYPSAILFIYSACHLSPRSDSLQEIQHYNMISHSGAELTTAGANRLNSDLENYFPVVHQAKQRPTDRRVRRHLHNGLAGNRRGRTDGVGCSDRTPDTTLLTGSKAG